jgi:hypothetical protein
LLQPYGQWKIASQNTLAYSNAGNVTGKCAAVADALGMCQIAEIDDAKM